MIGLGLIAAMAATTGRITFEVANNPANDERLLIWPGRPATFPEGVIADGDIIYAQPLHYRPLRLDVYRRPSDRPQPLIVHVHGGAWVNGTKRVAGPIRDFPAVLAQLAARGFVVASVEYRLDGEAKFPAAIQDVKAAIRFLRQHAQDYGIDSAHVGIFGESAGGQLAALAATSCGVTALEPAGSEPNDPSDCVQAAAPWYGVYDFETVPLPPGSTGPAPYLGCATSQCPPDKLRFASPVAYVDAKDPPMLLIHGAADTLVAPSQTVEFDKRLRAANVPVQTIMLPAVNHGLVGKSTEITAAAIHRALDATLAFFKVNLKQR